MAGLRAAIPELFPTPEGMRIAFERPLEEEWRQWQATRHGAASYPEFLVMRYLENTLRYREFEDYYFEVPLLGGSFISDVLVLRDQRKALDIEVMGVAYHEDAAFGDPAQTNAYDRMKRQALEDNGYAVAWVSDINVQNATASTVRAALNGRDQM